MCVWCVGRCACMCRCVRVLMEDELETLSPSFSFPFLSFRSLVGSALLSYRLTIGLGLQYRLSAKRKSHATHTWKQWYIQRHNSTHTGNTRRHDSTTRSRLRAVIY